MTPYENVLTNVEGIPATRSADICEALNELHKALSKLDNCNLRKFWKLDVAERLRDFAYHEDLRDVVPEEVMERVVKI